EVRFGRQNYFLDFDGNWKPKENTNLNKNSLYKDISPSTLTGKAVTTTTSGIIALQFRLNLISPQEASADGIKLTLPSNIQISSIEETLSKFNGRAIPYTQTGNEIFWGNNDTTQRGFYTFRGSEILTINVNSFTPPLNYLYIIYDDGFGNYPPEPINAEGNATITEIEFAEKTEKFWNLFNKTKNSNALEHQTIISGIDVNTNDEAPFGDEPIIDGFRIKIKGTFDPPKTISEVIINGKNITQPWSNGIFQDGYFKISDFNYFSNYINGTSFIKNGYGTNDINKLMQDYEFRFTGESDLIKVNNTKVYITKEGTGSFATFYGAQQYDITQHPLNDEKAERFLVRVPFEVWNKDLGIQVNYQFYDRDQYYDSLYSDFYTWNSFGRMYGEILNTPYTAELITEEMTQTMSDDFTWNNIWNTSAYNTGDIVEINYLNSIQQGDVFTFTTPNSPADKISPSEYNLFQNYPNPFNPNTKIRFTVPEEGLVKLTVYNILGQKIKELVNQNYKAGKYEAEFAGYQYASGVYIYRIEMNNFVKTKKMMLLK
ncbi:MAG: T9SS type A sorting domain-containing protein, partial [Ignavibacteriae bacterium]|nr:T9SS type A sorting domain-containing protein [Ignavibacteriota bacterium]